MTVKWKKIANRLAIGQYCIWHGWLDRSAAIEIMKSGHLFCITSISDLTSTVTLEALSCGLPIVCLDHYGFTYVVTEYCGIKIPVDSPSKAVINFKIALEQLYNDEIYRQKLSQGAILRANDFSWDKKIEQLDNIYRSLIC